MPTGNEDHTIPINDAAVMNKRWRDRSTTQPKGIFYSQATLNDILDQTGCIGIRFYFACDANNKMCLTFVGVDSAGNDLLDIVGDGGLICPTICGVDNILNSDTK